MAAQQAKNLFNRLSRVNYSEFQNPSEGPASSNVSEKPNYYQDDDDDIIQEDEAYSDSSRYTIDGSNLLAPAPLCCILCF